MPHSSNRLKQYKYPASIEIIKWMGDAYVSEKKARHLEAVGRLTFWTSKTEKKTVEEGTYLVKLKNGYLSPIMPEVYEKLVNTFRDLAEHHD